MLDLASKAAINFIEWHVSIQASNRAFQQVAKSDDSLQTSSILGNWV